MGNIDFTSALFGALISAVLGVFGGFLGKLLSDWKDGWTLRTTISAEIGAVLQMFEAEAVMKAVRGEIDWLEATREVREFPAAFRNSYNIVFAANAGRLGLMARTRWHDYVPGDDTLLHDLVAFYYSVQTIVEIADMLAAASPEPVHKPILGLTSPPVFSLRDPDHRLEVFRRLHARMLETRENACALVLRLERDSKMRLKA